MSVNFEMSFWYFQFSHKTNEKIQLYCYGTSRQIVFVRFLGELETPRRHFEINWPLGRNHLPSDFIWINFWEKILIISLHCDCKLRKFQSGTILMKPEWCQQFSTWCEKLVDKPIWNRDKSPSRAVGTRRHRGVTPPPPSRWKKS